MNVCINVCDAMPAGGRLTLASRSLGQGFVELSVQDQGDGMAPGVLAQAMEPFFTTKPAGKGTRVSMVFPPAMGAPGAPCAKAAPEARSRELLSDSF